MMSTINTMMWQTQNVLHKKPQVVPGILLLLASSLVVYRHMTHSGYEHETDVIKTFLAMILVQMLPLVALEMKIMSCADPVGLFCKFATPVTLIHAFFLGMRLLMSTTWHDTVCLVYSSVGCVGAIFAIWKGYRQSWTNIAHCSSVWGLITLALMASMCTTAVDGYFKPEWMAPSWEKFFTTVFETSNSYIELVAFVPAVWTVYRENPNESRTQVESADTVRTCTAFFLFLVGFYVTEDLVNAYFAFDLSWTASVAHLSHFFLLLDFACYILAHVHNPEKMVGELRKWLPSDLKVSYEV